MQLWSWLTGGKRQIEQSEMIWLTNRARLEGICHTLQEKSRNCQLLIVTSHFSDRLGEMRKLLNRDSTPFREADHLLRPGDIHREISGQNAAAILLAPASQLVSDEPPVSKGDPSYRIVVLLVECHPMRLFDERIEQFAAAIPYEVELQSFLALDDAGMKMFAGEWVRDVLTKLGMKEDEAITSSMIARRLKGAQRKVEERYEALQGLKRGLALDRLREEPPKEWRNAAEWLAAHEMESGIHR